MPRAPSPIATLRRLVAGGAADLDSGNIEALAALARTSEVALLAAEAAPALAPLLAAATTRQRQIDALLELALERAASALERAGLAHEVALLKGSVTVRTVYPSTAHRFRRDLDLLVPTRRDVDIGKIRDLLVAAGFADDAGPDDARRGPRAARAWPMVLRPFGPAGPLLSIDLHQRLTEVAWCHPDVPAILAEASPTPGPLPLSSPRDTLIHTAIHLADNGFCQPLKAWVDVARLVPTVAPAALAERARQHGARGATYAALWVAERWLGSATEAHRAALAPPRAQRLALHAALGGDGVHPHRLGRGPARRLFRALVVDDARAARVALGAALRPPGRGR